MHLFYFLQLLEITNHLLWNASSYYGKKFDLKILFLVRHDREYFCVFVLFCFLFTKTVFTRNIFDCSDCYLCCFCYCLLYIILAIASYIMYKTVIIMECSICYDF